MAQRENFSMNDVSLVVDLFFVVKVEMGMTG